MRKLILLFVMTLLPLAASAFGEVVIDGIKYRLNEQDKTAKVLSNHYSGDVEIPSKVTYNEVPYDVTSIGYSAFGGCEELTSVIIPNSITSLESSVFSGCSSLTSITIPNSVTDIENSSFLNCSSLSSVTMGNSVTSIGYKAFKGCGVLTSITIPSSLIDIGGYAFSGCSSLTSISIPDFVTTIGEYAFQDCSGLTSISIGKSLTSVGSWAFYGCSGLTSTEFHCKRIGNWFSDSKESIVEVVIGDEVTDIGYYAFSGYSGLTSITIPNSVTSIEESAFYGCTGLSSVIIPNSVTSLAIGAFQNCNGLESVTISNSVTSINSNAFSDCTSLTSVSIPESATSIGRYAFGGCSGLTSVTIPGSVTSIGSSAFDGCSGLTSVEIPNSVTTIGEKAFEECVNLETISIPNTITSCGYNAFNGTKWYDNQPNGLIYIGKVAYHYKGNMAENTTIIIKDGTTEISDYAFRCNYGLTSVTIPNSVKTIGYDAFDRCGGLTSINIPSSVTSIKNNAFEGCSGLNSIIVDNDNNVYDSRGYCNAIIETSTNTLISGCKNTIIPNGITSIGACAFWGIGLTSIIIPQSVISIGGDAFEHTSLTFVFCLATEVPSANNAFFLAPIGTATLFIPEGCYDKYAAVEPWKNFKEIKELKSDFIITPYDVNNDGSLDDDDMQNLLDIIMKRVEENDDAEAIYDTNNDGKIDVVDIVQLLGLMNDVKDGRLLDIDEENEGGYVDPTETEQQIGQLEADEDNASEVIYTDEEAINNDALAREVISLYDTDDDSDYYGGDVVKTRASYDDMAKEAIRSENGINRFDDEFVIDQQHGNIKNWGNTRYGGFKIFYNTREEDFVRYLYVVFYYKGGFPNKKTAYLKLGQLNSGKIISSTNILQGQEYAVLRVCIDKYIPGYGCFNVFPLLITEESKARNYLNPILVKSKHIVAEDWRNKYYGYEFGKVNGVSVYFNGDNQKGNTNQGNGWHQCVELCRRYVTHLNGCINRKETDTWGNAINWPANRANDAKDPGMYLVFANDGRERVREGDLIVWQHGTYGHIGVIISVKEDKISVAHQNGGTGTFALPIGTSMKLENGVIKDIVPGTNRSPIFKSIERVTHFIRINSPNEHITYYESSMTASTTNVKFSPTKVGRSVTQSFNISNPKGTESLNISSISLSKGDAFSVDVTDGSIPPGEAKLVRITFTPSSAGEFKDRIIIKSDADDNPTWVIHLTGTGVAD